MPFLTFWKKLQKFFGIVFQFYTRSFLHCKFSMNLICSVMITVIRKFPINSNGRMERLMCNFPYLGYYCSLNLSIHQNSTQELTWNFLVTLIQPVRVATADKAPNACRWCGRFCGGLVYQKLAMAALQCYMDEDRRHISGH